MLADLSMERFYQSAEKSQSVSLFEEYKDEKDTVRGRRLFLYIVGLILFLGIIITAQSYWIHRRRKRNKADREQHEREKASLEQEISQTLAEAQQKEERITALQKELKKALANPDFQKLPLVYSVRLTDGKELLLPAIKQCIREVNVEEGCVRVHVMDGLMD